MSLIYHEHYISMRNSLDLLLVVKCYVSKFLPPGTVHWVCETLVRSEQHTGKLYITVLYIHVRSDL